MLCAPSGRVVPDFHRHDGRTGAATPVEVPVLVLGAERDAIITISEIQRTARAYRTEAEIFPHLGHNMMLDEGWPKVADRIDAWVRQLPRGDRGEKSVSAADENVALGS